MKINVIKGDITIQKVDAIVNAANNSLMGGGGVDGAIHRAGGPQILKECKEIVSKQGELPTGEAVITSAGNMPAKFVIHTVGPVWHGGSSDEKQKLSDCYTNSLQLAIKNNCKTIAFPNISTGVYGYPKEKAAKVAVQTTQKFLQSNPEIEQVVFVCFDDENYRLISEEIKKLLF